MSKNKNLTDKIIDGSVLSESESNLFAENVINRNINELSKSLVAETLPEGVNNGNIITSDSVVDTRKWLIENNQKRIFPTLATFWGSAYAFSELVTLSISDINNIPDGDPID